MSVQPVDPGLIPSLRGLGRDGQLLFAMRIVRIVRMFGVETDRPPTVDPLLRPWREAARRPCSRARSRRPSPLMPTLPLAILVLLLRYSLSQMDVPTRQSYVMAVVEPDERSAAISPSLSSVMIASAGYAALPFYLAGGLKILYDLLLYRDFRNVRPPEERARRA